jgi:inhibitor of KinA sporulation pathway (predicted exonuclease)
MEKRKGKSGMDYLFIDIECANCKDGGKLCEFGYILVDQNFTVLQENNILINPSAEFDRYVLGHMLNYKKKDYDASPLFSAVYPQIFPLLTAKNRLIVGHTVGGDAVHIGDDCIRYNLTTPDFKYADVVEIYKEHTSTQNATSLVNMCAELGIETGDKVHSAGVDARLTMLVAKALCEKKGVSIKELIDNNPSCKGEIKNYAKKVAQKRNYKKYLEDCAKKGIDLINGERYNIIRLFRRFVFARLKLSAPEIQSKTICLSENYEREHYNRTLWLIQKIKNAGGTCVTAPSKCDIFVKYDIPTADGEGVYCKKLDGALQTKSKGKNIQIITVEELMKILKTDTAELDKPINKAVERFIKNKTKHAYSDQTVPATIGEIIENKKF